MKKAIINGGIGSKVICAVTDDVTLEAAPIKGTDNGDGTASLLVTSSMATLPDTVSGDLAAQTATLEDILAKIISAPSTEAKQDAIITALGLIASEATTGDIKTAVEALAALISAGALSVSLGELPDTVSGDLADINTASVSIDGKLPALVNGKIPVDASVSIDSVDIGDVDIKEFPAGNLGQQLKAASLSVAPATDIADATYIGDVKFGEELPAGTQLVGKVGIDQTTPGTTNLVNVNGGASQTADIKVTLDSESVAVTGPLTNAQLTTQALAKEATLASMAADIGTIQTDIATVASNSEITPATVTGTCTDAYVTALSLACAGVRNKTIMVVNTDAALTMKYRIRGYAKSGASGYSEIQKEATLAASTSQPHFIENSYDVITVEVIDGTGHATYAIDYCGGQ